MRLFASETAGISLILTTKTCQARYVWLSSLYRGLTTEICITFTPGLLST
ncbi:hypothetical protein HETIRDRAFT_174843 [Heterobasidion irregulare TC 32-1]|uniref:Uncharacterized protein n=1 Tax=Heterobasidion irregulare (strain TC 32-1) TaxID=747525 RepID=W4JTM8_HETIT|nr:uncharacterized protein HETIRDRAFT_174843 [Heterobasidion irregulare TC 32-1]ETW76794.1 hypothetical protein HETIRDRAFT_174843 [Heterobasidion irregulare TC 32-1]